MLLAVHTLDQQWVDILAHLTATLRLGVIEYPPLPEVPEIPVVLLPQPPINPEPIPQPPDETIPGGKYTIIATHGPVPEPLNSLLQRYWPSATWVKAANIAYRESGWHTNAHLDTTHTIGPCGTRYILPDGRRAESENSKGYFQLNTCVHTEPYTDAFYVPEENVRYAAGLYARSGWGPWGG